MSRSRHSMLPAITGGSPQPNEDNWITPRVESRALQRIDYLEDRLSRQEKTSQELLDRAYRVKEDLIDNLNLTHGSWKEEKRASNLLQEHIRAITDVVKRLGRDIMMIEEQLMMRQGASDGTLSTVKNLEMHHVSNLTDLRGRVGRCDSSIARLATDLKGCTDSIRAVSQQQQEHNAKIMEQMHSLDAKFNSILNKLDRQGAEQELHIRHVETGSTQQLSALDSKTRQMIEDTKNVVSSYKNLEQTERDRLEVKIGGQFDKSLSQRDMVMEKLDRKLDDTTSNMTRKILKLEEELVRDKEKNHTLYQNLEQRMMSLVDVQLKGLSSETTKLKRECRDGFGTIHDSITNMKQVMDGKRKLLEDQLRKEISQIRKMVVLV